MIKTTYHCDFCGKEVSAKDFQDHLFRQSKTKEWDTSLFVVCDDCAVKIDYVLLKFKVTHGEEARDDD